MQALLSVSDKTGLRDFAKGLVDIGFGLLSTGGTFEELRRAGLPVTAVGDYTGSPEILDGRVKTLHPKIHGGLLGRPELPSDDVQMRANGIRPINLLAVNLYPFRQAVARRASAEETVENIDIGGPAMIRAAAKNSERVAVVVDPSDYGWLLEELRATQGKLSAQTRKRLRAKAFGHTAAYDASVASWCVGEAEGSYPEELAVSYRRVQMLRYGENPHQRGAFYRDYNAPSSPTVAFSAVLQGKELSYNNLLDLDAALALVLEFSEKPAAVIVKHNNPCGVCVADNVESAFRRARLQDEVSAFGGIVALNREVTVEAARALGETFLEAVIAPAFTVEALQVLSAKKNLRLLAAGEGLAHQTANPATQIDYRSIAGGLLAMDRDAVEPAGEWKVVTERTPTADELAALKFAWKVCKHVKSNAIVFAAPNELLAAGAGQTSRVDSVKIAVQRAGERLRGSAVASDAFFPFRDGLDALAAAGARCVVQPGGSVRDAEVIEAANQHGIAMVFTGVRHFRH